jgi:hypothetical protein
MWTQDASEQSVLSQSKDDLPSYLQGGPTTVVPELQHLLTTQHNFTPHTQGGTLGGQASTVQSVAQQALQHSVSSVQGTPTPSVPAPTSSVQAQFTPVNLTKVKDISILFSKTEIHFSALYNGLAANIKETTLKQLASQSKNILDATLRIYKRELNTAKNQNASKKDIRALKGKVDTLKNMTSFSMRVVKDKLCVDIYAGDKKFTHTFDSEDPIQGNPHFTIGEHISELKANIEHTLKTDPQFANETGFTFFQAYRKNGGIIPQSLPQGLQPPSLPPGLSPPSQYQTPGHGIDPNILQQLRQQNAQQIQAP